MAYLEQVAFIILLAISGWFIFRRVGFIRANIKMGKDFEPKGPSGERFKKMMLLAFGQKKMFDKPLAGIMHFIIYIGFVLINIEVLEIILDGILGTHRLFAPFLGSFYNFIINFFELLAFGVVLACLVFLIRRNILNINRFQKIEMKGWPKMDANLILIIEILLMFAILSMNANDQLLQQQGAEHYTETGNLMISALLIPLYNGMSFEMNLFLERFFWWIHIVGIFAFAVYVTYSKHLHIFLAFPNTYFSNLEPFGKIKNMDDITQEVKIMLGMQQPEGDAAPPSSFGAKDVNQLTWKNLMDAYSCTECGRCTAECPANLTGKKLSPRKIMMDTRDRLEDAGKNGLDNGKTLLEDYIQEEEIMACTSCNACVEACPVSINPLEIILELRRYKVMEESKTPVEWTSMMTNIENSFSPWAFSPSDRFNWANDLKSEN